MPRALTVLMAAGAMLAGAQAASAQYYGPADYYDAPPRYYYDDGYGRYDRPRHGDVPPYHERPSRYHGYGGYRDVPSYGYRGRPYYRGYIEDDLFIHRRYRDYYGDDRVLQDEGRGNVRKRVQGFDPRRPHLGDGTDAPDEQYYARRPRSCGEYYYWDGRACVDARKYPPYVGPKP